MSRLVAVYQLSLGLGKDDCPKTQNREVLTNCSSDH